jgi:hypothetical protein
MTIPRRAQKRDANERGIIDALHAAGYGVLQGEKVDLSVWRGERGWLLEVKMPGEKLSNRQREFHATFPARIHVVCSAEEALEVVRARRSQDH